MIDRPKYLNENQAYKCERREFTGEQLVELLHQKFLERLIYQMEFK